MRKLKEKNYITSLDNLRIRNHENNKNNQMLYIYIYNRQLSFIALKYILKIMKAAIFKIVKMYFIENSNFSL